MTFAVDPLEPARLYVTNGASILASRDGGCTWRVSYRSSSTLPEASTILPPIGDIEVSRGRGGDSVVWATQLIAQRPEPLAAVLVSRDDGRTWTSSREGLPPITAFGDLTVAADGTAYLVAATGPRAGLYASADGRVWEKRWESTALGDGSALGVDDPLAADPAERSILWAGGIRLSRSGDGGRTWQTVDIGTTAPVRSIATHPPTDAVASRITVLHDGPSPLTTSTDGGSSWKRVPNAPALATSVVYRSNGNLVVAGRHRTEDDESVFEYDGLGWTAVRDSRPPDSITLVAADRAGGRSVYGLSRRGSRHWIEGHAGGEADEPSENAGLGHGGDALLECFEQEPAVPIPGMDAAPPGHDPVYSVNFHRGELVRFDRWGNGTVIATLPPYAEGIVLDALDRVIISTRHSAKLVRFDPELCRVDLISNEVNAVEAPQFDSDGSLYVVDTETGRSGVAGQIFQFRAPIGPGALPRRIWTGNSLEFTEDIEFAPEGSPYEGDLFVLLNNPADGGHCSDPDSIIRLHDNGDTWERHPFITKFPVADPDLPSSSCSSYAGKGIGFNALGFVFHPDGRVLVPDYGGSGVILEYAPDGSSYDVFGRVEGAPAFHKIDITPDGYVYITAADSNAFDAACSTDGSRVVRFGPEGQRLWPDFSDDLVCPVGVAVPHEIKLAPPRGLPPRPDPPPHAKTPRRTVPVRREMRPRAVIAAAFAPLPPPPPPVPVTAPAPANAPSHAVQQMPSPARAPNPQPAAVAQQQEQPQMALVHAAQHLREQLGAQNAMVRTVQHRSDPLEAARLGLAMSGLAMVLMYGLATVTIRRALARR